MGHSIEFLRRVALFASFEDQDLETLLELSDKRPYRKNNVVLYRGGQGVEIFIIEKGKVKITLKDKDSKEIILKILKKGDFFGEMSLFGDSKISATVETLTQCEFMVIHKDHIRKLVMEKPALAMKLLTDLSNRLRSTNELLRSIVFDDVKQRIIRILLNPLGNVNGEGKSSKSVSNLSVTVIAGMAGTTRESASRVLNDLNKNGHIRLTKNKIELISI